MKSTLQVCLLIASIAFGTLAASAQEVVHAVTGVVTAIDPAGKTIQLKTDDGTEGLFTTVKKPGVSLDPYNAKVVQADAKPAAAFTATNTQVLVYFIGYADVRTAVAIENLGAGPFEKIVGTVTKLDKHVHLLTIKSASGEESFQIAAKTVGEASEGVTEAEKLDLQPGTQVRVIATKANGSLTAHFIRVL